MDIERFSISKIERLPAHGIFVGTIEVAIENEDGVSSNVAVLRLRFILEETATYAEIEAKLLEEACSFLGNLIPLLERETVQSLRQRISDRESARVAAEEAEHQAQLGKMFSSRDT